MNYFAYGSNMLEERLRSADRVPGAIFKSVGHLIGYKLQFNKPSTDESGKCNIVETGNKEDIVYGVVYEIPDAQIEKLDVAEGVGPKGYLRINDIPVCLEDENKIIYATTYVANVSADNLIPYDWYSMVVISGAVQHRLPKKYISKLLKYHHKQDKKPDRTTKRQVENAIYLFFFSDNAESDLNEKDHYYKEMFKIYVAKNEIDLEIEKTKQQGIFLPINLRRDREETELLRKKLLAGRIEPLRASETRKML